MQFRCKCIGKALLLARWNLHAISRCCQVSDDDWWIWSAGNIDWSCKRATNELQGDRTWLVVGDVEKGVCGMAVHEFDAEDLAVREGCTDVHGEIGGFEVFSADWQLVVGYFFNFFDLGKLLVFLDPSSGYEICFAYRNAFREFDVDC